MGARYIECSVNNEFVSGAGQVIGAAGSHHDVYLRLTFGEMWDGLSVYVTFRDALGENPTVVTVLPTALVLGTEATYDVAVPAAAKARQGKAMVTVQGYTVVNGTQEASATNTATAYFTVLPSDYALADDESIDATIAQQLQSEIDEISETITDARLAAQDAEAWAVGQIEGADVPETDDRYENNSKYYAQRADESAAEAYASASAAFASASSASGSATAAAGSAATAAGSATAAANSAAAAATSETNAAASADNAAGSAAAAAQSATAAEGYKNTASQMAANAAGSASAAAGSATAAGTSETNAATSASTASGSASAAATSAATANQKALNAEDSAEDSEAWAVGQRGGTDVPSSDETYHNNSKYWAEQAEHAAAGGVTSFNGRAGIVVPQQGDYTAAMVGADASGAAAAVQDNLDAHASNTTIHITAAERTAWNAKADASALTTHTGNGDIHVTAEQKTAWNAKANFPDGGTEGQILTKTATGAEWDDAPLGFAPQVVVTAPTGSTVTLTSGTTTLNATESGGTWTFDVPSYGTWTATATLSGQTATGSVSVTEVKQYTISLAYIPEDVDKATWAQISEVSQAGTGDTYWDVGDTKAITLNGTIGTKSYSNVTLYLFILHFNMPVNKSTADNNIIWGGFKTAKSGGIDVCLDDSAYNTDKYDGTKCFNMNHNGTNSGSEGTAGWYGTNYGGWKGTDLRYDILGATNTQPSQYNQKKNTSNVGYDATQAAITSPLSNTLMAALPSDFRNVLRLWTRWMDSKGNKSNVDANVTSCVDAGISLLTEFEVFGTRSYANQYEQNHQVQCAYYVAGNSKVKYKQSSTGTSAYWWESSARCNNVRAFCYVYTNGNASSNYACSANGLAPAFKT